MTRKHLLRMFVCRQCRLTAAIGNAYRSYRQLTFTTSNALSYRKLSILPNLAIINHSSTNDDEEHIVESIDHPPRYQQRKPYFFQSTKPITGLFGYTSLQHPTDLVTSAQETLRQAKALVDLVCRTINDEKELRKVVKRLDRLSDLICSVVDGAEVVKNVHPDSRWVAAAKEAHLVLSDYLNQLNTHTGLYKVNHLSSQWGSYRIQIALAVRS